MLHDTGLVWVSSEDLDWSKQNKQLSKEVLKGGGGEVQGPFKQVLTAHIFHAILFSIALRPGLSKRS